MTQAMFTDVWDHPTTAKADARGLALEELLAIDVALAQLQADDDLVDGPEGELRTWLDAFAAAVRDVDYAAGKRLFASGVVGFGTAGAGFNDRDELVADHWKPAWPDMSGFRFNLNELNWGVDGDSAWVAVPWSCREGPHDRTGRATFVLQRRGEKWMAVHAHHSVDPAASAR